MLIKPYVSQALGERKRLAFHEAGHAALALLLDKRFDWASVDELGGCVSGYSPFANDDPELGIKMVQSGIVVAAGAASESIIGARSIIPTEDDHRTIQKILAFANYNQNDWMPFYMEARKLLLANWAQVYKLANELNRTGFLNYEQCKQIFHNK